MMADVKNIVAKAESIESLFISSALIAHINASDLPAMVRANLLYVVTMYQTYDNS